MQSPREAVRLQSDAIGAVAVAGGPPLALGSSAPDGPVRSSLAEDVHAGPSRPTLSTTRPDEGNELWHWLENVMIEVQGAQSSHIEVRSSGTSPPDKQVLTSLES